MNAVCIVVASASSDVIASLPALSGKSAFLSSSATSYSCPLTMARSHARCDTGTKRSSLQKSSYFGSASGRYFKMSLCV